MIKKNRKKIVVIGGGTGTYTTLLGLKKYPVDLSVIITMMDTGGSNRVLRDEFGLLPTSDIRQCMVALASSHSHEVLRKLFTYRYNSGTGITGMTFGNLFMAALTDIYSSQEEAIKKTCEILDVQGKILPVTYDNVHLLAQYDNDQQLLGEHLIDEPPKELGGRKIKKLSIVPKAKVNPQALRSIAQADLIIMGPGDLYTSTICNFVVDNVAGAIRKSKAKKVYVMNLMNRYSQTHNFQTSDYINELEKYLGKETIDIVLMNKSFKVPHSLLRRYKEEKATIIKDNLVSNKKIKIIKRNFLSKKIYVKSQSDKLERSLLRHDSASLAKAIISLL